MSKESNKNIEVEMDIKKIPLNKIKPYWRNARKNDKTIELVKRSIQKYGYNVPIQIDKDNVIIAGHARYKALLQLGWQFAYCVVKDDLSPEEVKEYRLIDNKSQEATEWIEDDLYVELRQLDPLIMQDFFPDIDLDEINTDEVTGYKGVSEEDLEDKQEELDGKFKGLTDDDKGRKIEVICPECGHEFFINKEEFDKKH